MSHSESVLSAAQAGDRKAFDALIEPLSPRLSAFAYRMVAHPEDAEELVQDALLKAHQSLASFEGRSSFDTWVFSILTRCCLNHLRQRRRWHWDAQAEARRDPEAPHHEVLEALQRPDSRFEAREHLAFCFSCVARSLSPEEAAALLLRDVYAYGNAEAARICDVSESVLRHRLSAARAAMQDAFEGLCGLVSKRGVCHQCRGLRDNTPAGQRGPEPPDLSGPREESYRRRLVVLEDADLIQGGSAALHRVMFRLLAEREERSSTPRGA